MMQLEQKLDDEELFKSEITKAKKFSRGAIINFLYGLIPGIFLISTSLYLTYRDGEELLIDSYQQCQQIDDKMTIRDLPFGRYNCQDIERLYSEIQ
jgi:hypothetical protein